MPSLSDIRGSAKRGSGSCFQAGGRGSSLLGLLCICVVLFGSSSVRTNGRGAFVSPPDETILKFCNLPFLQPDQAPDRYQRATRFHKQKRINISTEHQGVFLVNHTQTLHPLLLINAACGETAPEEKKRKHPLAQGTSGGQGGRLTSHACVWQRA